MRCQFKFTTIEKEPEINEQDIVVDYTLKDGSRLIILKQEGENARSGR